MLKDDTLTAALDGFDFKRVAQYMSDTNWIIEDLHDDQGPDNHRRFTPSAEWLRQYAES